VIFPGEPQVKGAQRDRHPLLDPDLDTPMVVESADEVTIIIKRANGATLTATFKGDRLETAIASSSEVEYPEDIEYRPRPDRPTRTDRHYNLRLDLLRGSTCTYTVTTEEDPA
jgi:hypothetical protein